MSSSWRSLLLSTLGIILLDSFSTTQAACQLPKQWAGSWFQLGVNNLIHINSTHIETKGECFEEQGEKVVLYDKVDNCYRCMAMHVKHSSVLQYKETFCETSHHDLCYDISGDAPLYSMFRQYPEPKPIPCPFKSAPFSFQYNKGGGDCSNPPSKAESCTDDSRLVLKYQACPDVPGTESNVEELICLAVWKEGSTRYLVGKIAQWNRRAMTSDEDQYRCFIYQREEGKDNAVIYHIAQSGDASCNGMTTAFEGSKTMKLKTMDNHHNRCKFPTWITDHHTWLSLDHKKTYKFSQRNATLKIVDEDPKPVVRQHLSNYAQHFGFQEHGFESQEQRKQNAEMRVVCHSIPPVTPGNEQKKVQVIAHITHGCDSGYICMVFHKRDNSVIEIQQSENYEENAEDACRLFNAASAPFTTLITTTLHPKSCPHLGRYNLESDVPLEERRKKRQQPNGLPQKTSGINPKLQTISGSLDSMIPPPECVSHDYEALAVGCGNSHEVMEFRTPCIQQPITGYTCHGSWQENNTYFVITSPVSRKSTDSLRYCFMYTFNGLNHSPIIEGSMSRNAGPHVLMLSGVSGNCNRDIIPGIKGNFKGNWAFNFTSNGTCAENDAISGASSRSSFLLTAAVEFVLVSWVAVVILR